MKIPDMLAFGPVPSRRLGSSLGINHIPPKHCSYSCVYCQVGRTTKLEIARRPFYPVDRILRDVEKKIKACTLVGQPIDYLTLVPDGEPTLDIHFHSLIGRLREFQIPLAVISNAALIGQNEVQEALLQADWVSVKVDAVDESVWRKINRPHRRLSLPSILEGILQFRTEYEGKLVTETMLVSGINDRDAAISQLADFLLELQPDKAYLSIPTRPPAEPWVEPPAPERLQDLLEILSERIPLIDLLFETGSTDFHATGNLAEDILGITSVHPINEGALRHMLASAGGDWRTVEMLLATGKITAIHYRGEVFYCKRRLK